MDPAQALLGCFSNNSSIKGTMCPWTILIIAFVIGLTMFQIARMYYDRRQLLLPIAERMPFVRSTEFAWLVLGLIVVFVGAARSFTETSVGMQYLARQPKAPKVDPVDPAVGYQRDSYALPEAADEWSW